MSRGFDQWLDLAWAAGVLEGEGCFYAQKNKAKPLYTPTIRVRCRMTDEDIIIRLKAVLGVGSVRKEKIVDGKKPTWVLDIPSKQAKVVMKQILPFMGIRRTARIKQLLSGDYRTVKQTLDDLTSNMVQCKNNG